MKSRKRDGVTGTGVVLKAGGAFRVRVECPACATARNQNRGGGHGVCQALGSMQEARDLCARLHTVQT